MYLPMCLLYLYLRLDTQIPTTSMRCRRARGGRWLDDCGGRDEKNLNREKYLQKCANTTRRVRGFNIIP